jgi:hypothetical protein
MLASKFFADFIRADDEVDAHEKSISLLAWGETVL